MVFAALAAATLGGALGAQAQSSKEQSKKQHDPAEVQRAIEAGAKLLNGGKAEQAVRSLTDALSGGNLPPAVMAKALYLRGMAYRQQRKPAHALSDLTSALWLKGGLGGDDRADAIRERAAAYADAGLTERGQPIAAASESPAPPPAGSKKAGGWLGNIFGSPDPPAPPAHRPKVAAAADTGGWGSGTQVVASRDAPAQPVVQPPKAEAPPAAGEGRLRVQVAAVRSETEARALAAKAKREHATALGAAVPEIDRAVHGNMGTFYLVRFGPFATEQETQAVCATLKRGGFDCMPVPP